MSTINGTASGEELDGTTGNDTINGLGGDDILYGDAGNDVLNGGDGNDDLEGGAGNDTLDGGTGFNFASYVVATAGVTVNLSITGAQNTGAAGSDTLKNIQGLIGSDHNDTLTGNSGDNILDGRGGRDTLIGGAGNDILQISSPFDLVPGEKYDGGTGHDALVFADGQYDLSSSTITGIEELDGQNVQVNMTPAQLNGMTWLAVNGISLTGSGTADLSGAHVAANTFSLGDPATLILTGSTGPGHIIDGSSGDDHIFGGDGGDTITTHGGNNTVVGGSGGDSIFGDTGNDTLSGGDGIDFINGGGGNDVLNGDGGNDIINSVGTGNSTLNGGDGNDTLTAEHAIISMNGGNGDDTLNVNDPFSLTAGVHLSGGAGTDSLIFDDSGYPFVTDLTGVIIDGIEKLTGGALLVKATQLNGLQYLSARDITITGAGQAHLGAATNLPSHFAIQASGVTLDLGGFHAHDFLIDGSAYGDVITGGAYANFIYGNGGSDVLTGGAGADQIWGGAGNDTIGGGSGGANELYGEAGQDTISGGAGADQISGGDGADILDGNAGNDQINGDNGNDTIHGGDGNDLLWGQDGMDIVDGGAGNDQLFIDAGTEIVTGEGYYGGDGYDRLVVSGDVNLRTVTIGSDLEELDATGVMKMTAQQLDNFTAIGSGSTILLSTGGTIDFTGGNVGTVEIDFGAADTQLILPQDGGFSGFYTVQGNSGNDQISGGKFDDILKGGAGNDTIFGGAGNDTLYGGTGVDILDGGAGNDTVWLETASDTSAGAQFIGGTGTDTLLVSVPTPVDLSNVNWSGFEILNVEFTSVTLTAAQLSALRTVSSQSVKISTGGTIDLTHTQFNSSTIFLNSQGNIVLLPTNDSLIANFNVSGGAGNDTVTGGTLAACSLYGNGGNDTLTLSLKSGGDLHGGDGNDILTGGNNDDQLNGDAGNDVIHASLGSDMIDGGSGIDTVTFSALAAAVTADLSLQSVSGAVGQSIVNVENLTGTNSDDTLVGDINANTLVGGAGADSLIGGAGIDRLTGGTGNDTFVFRPGDLDGSVSNATAEHITDFSQTDGDLIDLQAIDAIAGGADDPFTFIGQNAFGHHAGELRYQFSGTTVTYISGDTDGDGVANFVLRLDTHVTLGPTDFLL